jgi:hypothetical protein
MLFSEPSPHYMYIFIPSKPTKIQAVSILALLPVGVGRRSPIASQNFSCTLCTTGLDESREIRQLEKNVGSTIYWCASKHGRNPADTTQLPEWHI